MGKSATHVKQRLKAPLCDYFQRSAVSGQRAAAVGF
jgi:hypothetical protein